MIASLQQLGIDRLSVPERLDLIGLIWESISEDSEGVPLSEAQEQDLDRRLANRQSNPQDMVPWETVKAEALARLVK